MAIKVLEAIQQIQLHPAMWIDAYTPEGVIREVVENAADELLNRYGDKLYVYIQPYEDTIRVTVADNGRGIPITKVKLPNSDKEIDSVIAICCHLFSGEKFDKDTYQHSTGLHGVGLVVVNALSRKMTVQVKKGDKLYQYYFEKGRLIDRIVVSAKETHPSTLVSFIPDPQYFGQVPQEVDAYERIYDLLKLLSTYGFDIRLNDQQIKYTLQEFLAEKLPGIEFTEFKFSTREYTCEYYFSISEDPVEYVHGYVNLHKCGGEHIKAFRSAVASVCSKITGLSRYIFEQRVPFVGFVWAKRPKFESQAKINFVNSDFQSTLNKKIDILSKVIENNFGKVLDAIKEKYTASKLSRQIKKTISADNPLKDCRFPDKGILYILEGESAGSGFAQVRNKDYEAVMMLGGKVTNVWKDPDAVFKKGGEVKKELKWLLEAVGWTPKGKPRWRYKEIKILTDPDPDGQHITVLVVLILYEYCRQLIEEKRVKIILTPIYLGVKGKNYVPIYRVQDRNKFSKVIRIKGLAQIPPKILREILNNPLEFTIGIPEHIEELKAILLSNVKTALLEKETLGFISLLESIVGNRKNS